MDVADIAALSRCMPMLGEKMEAVEIIPRLVSAGVLRIPIAQQINEERTSFEKNLRLAMKLRTCGQNAFAEFLSALQETGQDQIAIKLEENRFLCVEDRCLLVTSAVELLKNYYSSTFCKCQPFSGLPFTFDVRSTFVSVTMKSQNSTTEDHCSLIKEALIKTQHSQRKLMIIEGNAATGKTSLMRRIAYDWSTGKLSQFDIVLYAEFRQLTEGDYASVVAIGMAGVSFFLEVPQVSIVQKYVQNLLLQNQGEKILVLLDGYDEGKVDHCRQLERVLCDEICPHLLSYVILSSRPEHVAKCRLNEDRIAVASVLGFESDEQKNRYIRQHFLNEENAEECIRSVEEKLKTHPYLLELAATPLFLVLLCIVSKECKNDSISELYRKISIWMLKRYIKDHSEAKIPELTNCDQQSSELTIENCLHEISIFRKLGKMAFEMLCNKTEERVVFSFEDLKNYQLPEYILKIGLLATDDRLVGTVRKLTFMFPHKSFQEFYAAMYFWYWCDDADICVKQKLAVTRDQKNLHRFVQDIAKNDKRAVDKYENIFFSMFRDYAVGFNKKKAGLFKNDDIWKDEVVKEFLEISNALCSIFDWDLTWVFAFDNARSSEAGVLYLDSVNGECLSTTKKSQGERKITENEAISLMKGFMEIFCWENHENRNCFPKPKCSIAFLCLNSRPVNMEFVSVNFIVHFSVSTNNIFSISQKLIHRCIFTDSIVRFCSIFNRYQVFLENMEMVTKAVIYLDNIASCTETLSIILTLICNMSGERHFSETFKLDNNGFIFPESLFARLAELKNCSGIQDLTIYFEEALEYCSVKYGRYNMLMVLASEMQSLTRLKVDVKNMSEEGKSAIEQAGRQRHDDFQFEFLGRRTVRTRKQSWPVL